MGDVKDKTRGNRRCGAWLVIAGGRVEGKLRTNVANLNIEH